MAHGKFSKSEEELSQMVGSYLAIERGHDMSETYLDTDGTEIFNGDIVTATETILSGAIGCNIPYAAIGVFCGSSREGFARVAWVGIGWRMYQPFKLIRLYEEKSIGREAK
jgi:hypothetical protein